MHTNDLEFEFERRFFVPALPAYVSKDNTPSLIVQGYFLAKDGYAIRVRATMHIAPLEMDHRLSIGEIIATYCQHFDVCMLTAKGPGNDGIRYETENPVDPSVALQMILRADNIVTKFRYGYLHAPDGWVIDYFLGDNQGLVIAECERDSPVDVLVVPEFCCHEVTNDRRFSNDELSHTPFNQFAAEFQSTTECCIDHLSAKESL